ncbi:hypothetical protein KIL84_013639 [Mauremys mutica]|uniref:Uncharacterized protein n=1 Tax=Mauremys mutica TaxID=74926 RepID=A0A9D4ASL9_9SAUR|nr:hypothetical protein KIL84_013639 [Mauremys mutica]
MSAMNSEEEDREDWTGDFNHAASQDPFEAQQESSESCQVSAMSPQMKRKGAQVVLLTEGLSSRAVLMLELKNSLESLTEKLRSLLDFENHFSEVLVAQAELIQMIELCQALRNRLQRNHQIKIIFKE